MIFIIIFLSAVQYDFIKCIYLDFYVIRSEDGKLSCGHSSFRGKRATMEDFYDIKNTNIDGQTVCMFGIFDGSFPLPLIEVVELLLFYMNAHY